MTMELGIGRTPESKISYEPTTVDPAKTIEQRATYEKAMNQVGKKLATDLIANVKSGDPVNSEQFIHDMMTNQSFSETIMQQYSNGDEKLKDFIKNSGLSNDLFEKNKDQLKSVINEFKARGELPPDADLYGTDGIQVVDGRLNLVGRVISDSQGGKHYNVDFFVGSKGNITASNNLRVDPSITGGKL